ncbi:regulatory protein GemA [Bosea sp. TWI1241]|uniref:regulatory protein GemA n=1 Tax=Bosea sp. TWI1241 TaxID=3148904 RepID=UPI00320B5E1D
MIALALISPAQLRAIHSLKGKARLDDALYRDMLRPFGVVSSKELTTGQAAQLIDRLQAASPRQQHPKAVAMTGRYGAKIRALWISGWNLGVVRDRTDEAACAFVERQTGVQRTAWLTDPAKGRAAIEALKAWLAREAGIEWPSGHDAEVSDHKRAVLIAQWGRLVDLGIVHPGATRVGGLLTIVETQLGCELASLSDPRITSADLDKVSTVLGRRIRKARPAR